MSTNLSISVDPKALVPAQASASDIQLVKPEETETSKDPSVSELPRGKGSKKQTPSPSKKTKPAEAPIQPLPRDPNVVPSSDLIKDYVAYADRWENPAIMH